MNSKSLADRRIDVLSMQNEVNLLNLQVADATAKHTAAISDSQQKMSNFDAQTVALNQKVANRNQARTNAETRTIQSVAKLNAKVQGLNQKIADLQNKIAAENADIALLAQLSGNQTPVPVSAPPMAQDVSTPVFSN